MAEHEYWQIDAFSSRPLRGNAADVVFDADDLDVSTMQAIAREMNLSETVFMLRPTDRTADYRLRFFTPRSELPFAGHPTLAAAFAWRRRLRPEPEHGVIRQQCAAGLIEIAFERKGNGHFSFLMTQRPPVFSSTELERSEIAACLGAASEAIGNTPLEVVSTGVPWLIVPITSLNAISALEPQLPLLDAVCRRLGAVGLTAFATSASNPRCRIRLRTFAPGEGVTEDPACGSGNGSVAAYGLRHGYWPGPNISYRAEQGVEMGRAGEIDVVINPGEAGAIVRIGGQAVRVASGRLDL